METIKKTKRAKKRTIQYWNVYKARNEAIKFFGDYSLIASEAKNKAIKGTGLKILTPKQSLQILPIALA